MTLAADPSPKELEMNCAKTADGEALSGHQKANSTMMFTEAYEILGGLQAASSALNLTRAEFAALVSGDKVVSSDLAVSVELLTGGRVRKCSLRPDLWSDDTLVLAEIEGIDVDALCGKDLEFKAAFEAFRDAFTRAQALPCVATFRKCVAASDHFERVAASYR